MSIQNTALRHQKILFSLLKRNVKCKHVQQHKPIHSLVKERKKVFVFNSFPKRVKRATKQCGLTRDITLGILLVGFISYFCLNKPARSRNITLINTCSLMQLFIIFQFSLSRKGKISSHNRIKFQYWIYKEVKKY